MCTFLVAIAVSLQTLPSIGFHVSNPVILHTALYPSYLCNRVIVSRLNFIQAGMKKGMLVKTRQTSRVLNIKCGTKDSGDQFAALALPLNPDPSLSPENVITCLMRGLRWNDVPKRNTRLERCFNFADSMCRAAVGGHSSNAAGTSLENFITYAKNPVFSKMVSCDGFETEPINVLPGSETRGALATQAHPVPFSRRQ